MMFFRRKDSEIIASSTFSGVAMGAPLQRADPGAVRISILLLVSARLGAAHDADHLGCL
jgi:hypothetical protein